MDSKNVLVLVDEKNLDKSLDGGDASTISASMYLSTAEIRRDLSKVEGYACIVAPKMIQTVLKYIANRYPLSDFGLDHIKRVKSMELKDIKQMAIFICPVSSFSSVSDTISDEFSKFGISILVSDLHHCSVPCESPLDNNQKKEWEEECKWPLKSVALPLTVASHVYFTPNELFEFRKGMKLALEQSKKAEESNYPPIGVSVVDDTGCVIAAAHGLSCFETTQSHQLKGKHRLDHGVMRCIEEVARVRRTVGPADYRTMGCCQTKEEDRDPKRLKIETNTDYLCTNCDVYVTREPCVMCAMALVHSRARRIFYGVKHPWYGGFGSILQLQSIRSLNHRFKVYGGLLYDECLSQLERFKSKCVSMGMDI